jgi:hypothetical protein
LARFEKALSSHVLGKGGAFVIPDAAAKDRVLRKGRNIQKMFLRNRKLRQSKPLSPSLLLIPQITQSAYIAFFT